MAYDPVCRVEVNESETAYTSEHQGTRYYFCSADCKHEFEAHPDRYAASESAAGYGAAAKAKTEQTYRKFKESQTYQKALERGEEFKGKAREQTKSLIEKQRGRTSEMLGGVAAALRQTAQQLQSQQQGAIARYTDKAAQKADQLSGYFSGKDADQLISDAERLVRRRPGLFLGGAFAAGFVFARFLKSSGMRPGRLSEGAGSYSAGTGI